MTNCNICGKPATKLQWVRQADNSAKALHLCEEHNKQAIDIMIAKGD